jgi:hypothetical protein
MVNRWSTTGMVAALVAAALLAGCGLTRPAASVGPTQDPALVAALGLACAGRGIPGAGAVVTSGNHLVVLDLSGRELHWLRFSDETEKLEEWGSDLEVPPEWQPSSLGDAELVACIQADETPTKVEVCKYNGPSITRYAATREVVVIEAASGRVLATIAMTKQANPCGVVAKRSTTALYGSVSPTDVWTYLASLVDHGSVEPGEYAVAGQKVLDQLGPWGLESAAAAFQMDLPTLRDRILTVASYDYAPQSLEALAVELHRDYALVRAGIHDGVKTQLDARVAAGSMTADVEAFTLQRLDKWLADGGRPVSPS